MQVIRGCLSLIGLMCVLVVGGCALSIRGCSRVLYNPTVWSESVAEAPDKTRRMLGDFLQTATYEPDSAHVVGGMPAAVAVQDFTDGTIHLTMDRGGDAKAPRLIEVVVRVTPEDERSRVEVISDATALAAATHGSAPAVHRRIHSEIERALDAIDHQQPLPGGLSIAKLIEAAHDDR